LEYGAHRSKIGFIERFGSIECIEVVLFDALLVHELTLITFELRFVAPPLYGYQ